MTSEMSGQGFLVLEDGKVFSGQCYGDQNRVGEVVFNTSHSGYEEIATDPSYYSQIMVMTSSQQGNYGVDDDVWESHDVYIEGFVCLEIQNSNRENGWLRRLNQNQRCVLSGVDTRRLTFYLRDRGTPWGAIVRAKSSEEAVKISQSLISQAKRDRTENNSDWPFCVSTTSERLIKGENPKGPKVAIIDFGCKRNIVRELKKRCSEVKMFSSRAQVEKIKEYNPDGILLSNGPGDPALVENSVENIKNLLGWKPIFGICMGHQLLSLALGARTYKLRFGHRGSNHPIEDSILNKVYMTSQNHGYVVDRDSLPQQISVTHVNLNDQTVAGISCESKKCFSVQFHPESHPGPRDSEGLFDYFIERLL